WMVNNRTPYAAERIWALDKDARKFWVVAVKATFDIRPDGRTRLAEKQPPVLIAPESRGEPGKSSLLYEADTGQTKPPTAVIANALPPAGPRLGRAGRKGRGAAIRPGGGAGEEGAEGAGRPPLAARRVRAGPHSPGAVREDADRLRAGVRRLGPEAGEGRRPGH